MFVSDQTRRAGHASRHDGNTHGLRFQQHVGQSFAQAAEREYVDRFIDHCGVRLIPQEPDTRFLAQVVDQLLQTVTLRPVSGDDQRDIKAGTSHLIHGHDQPVEPLFCRETPHGAYEKTAGRNAEVLLGLFRRMATSVAVDVNGVFDQNAPFTRYAGGQTRVVQVFGDADDPVISAQTPAVDDVVDLGFSSLRDPSVNRRHKMHGPETSQ